MIPHRRLNIKSSKVQQKLCFKRIYRNLESLKELKYFLKRKKIQYVCTRIQTRTFTEFKSNGNSVKRFWPHCNMGMVGKEGYQCPEHVFSIAIGWLLPSVVVASVVCTILPRRPLLSCSSTQTLFLQYILDPLTELHIFYRIMFSPFFSGT